MPKKPEKANIEAVGQVRFDTPLSVREAISELGKIGISPDEVSLVMDKMILSDKSVLFLRINRDTLSDAIAIMPEGTEKDDSFSYYYTIDLYDTGIYDRSEMANGRGKLGELKLDFNTVELAQDDGLLIGEEARHSLEKLFDEISGNKDRKISIGLRSVLEERYITAFVEATRRRRLGLRD